MLLRFGYVAMSTLLKDCSPSKTVTYKTFSQLRERDPEAAINKVRRTARENLTNTLRLLRHSVGNNVRIYRFSSKVIPLATHPDLSGWDYIGDLKDLLEQIGSFVKEKDIRVSFHPDHFTLINTPNPSVFQSSLRDYAHHCLLLEAMGLDERARIVTHVGGGYGNKTKSLTLFLKNWEKVPEAISRRITLENDDRTYTARDVLWLCEQLSIPMVLDIHHHLCCREEDSRLEEIIPRFLDSWKGSGLNPKIHVSSPRSEKDLRSHHEYVDPEDIYPFFMVAAKFLGQLDIMVEAKKKDEAMFKLVNDLMQFPGFKKINEATLEFL